MLRSTNKPSIAKLEARIKELEARLGMDKLTGLGNHDKMVESLQQHLTSLTRTEQPLSVVFVDMDNLKPINDKKGHQAGDDALRAFAKVLKKSAREVDTVCRNGGDEFVIILPNTDEEGAKKFTDRITRSLSNGIRVSAGSATIMGPIVPVHIEDKMAFLLGTADQRMYAVKKAKKLRRVAAPVL